MDIALFHDSVSESSQFSPVRLSSSPWREILPLLASEGEESFVKKMVKALQKQLPRLGKNTRTRFASGDCSFLAWNEPSQRESDLEVVWNQLIEAPDATETLDMFRRWQEHVHTGETLSTVELWRLLTVLLVSGRRMSREIFWAVWNAASHGFASLQDSLEIPEGAEGPADQFLVATCELRWLSLVVFTEMGTISKLVKEARAALSDWLSFIGDEQVPLDSSDWSRLPAVWRSLGRILLLVDIAGHAPFRRREQKPLKRLIETTLAVSDPEGKVWGCSDEIPWRIVADVAEYATGSSSSKLSKQVRLVHSGKTKSELNGRPSRQSDTGEWAILRSAWQPFSDVALVRHDTPNVQLTVGALGQKLLAGPWNLELRSDGQSLSPKNPWECVCWFSDSDGDYLELQQVFSEEIRVERQLFLSRKDHFLFLNEVAHLPSEGKFELRSSFPLCSGLTLKRDKQTREYQVREGRSRIARMFPLSFAQETIYRAPGEIIEADGSVTLTSSGAGGFCLPVVFDWHPKRQKLYAEWRQLTISENRKPCKPSQAAGYRLRIGQRHHLMIYRAIEKTHFPRAILGHHTTNETVIADFDQEGEANPLLLVE